MYYFGAAQQTSTVKLPALFLKFQMEDRDLKLIKKRLPAKTLLMQIIFRWKETMEHVITEKTLFWVFLMICRQCLEL